MAHTGKQAQGNLTIQLIEKAFKNPTEALNWKILEQGIKDGFVGVEYGNPVKYHWKIGGREKANTLPTKTEYQIFEKFGNAEDMIQDQLKRLGTIMFTTNKYLKPFGLILSKEDGSIITL